MADNNGTSQDGGRQAQGKQEKKNGRQGQQQADGGKNQAGVPLSQRQRQKAQQLEG